MHQTVPVAVQPRRHTTIIGGLFGLECGRTPSGPIPQFLTGREIFLVNARCGIWLIVNALRPSRVWIPSYLCRTIIGAIDPTVTDVRFYEIDYDLNVRSNTLESEVTSGDLVFFIDYFGFPFDRQLGTYVKSKGAWVLEDACQALLSSHVGGLSDYVLFSVRKWIGVPDGGILRVHDSHPLIDHPLGSPPSLWWLKALQASLLRREFDEGLPGNDWFKLFREAEDTAPTGPYTMSHLSRAVIEYSVDYSVITQRRRDNYQSLLEKLAPYAVYPHLEPGVVPLGFPVRVANRNEVRERLFNQSMYPPVHWLIEGVIPSQFKDSHRLSRDIMTLPCDQRYGPEDMERMAEAFLQKALAIT